MEMTMRWYGKDYDTVTLEQIRQTCYVKGIITTLYNKMPGEVWTLDEILAMKKEVEDAGLHLAGIESVNVSDALRQARRSVTKTSLPTSRLWKISEKLISIWYATTSCRYSTGQEPSWTAREQTAPRFWLTIRTPSTRWIRKQCSPASKTT